LNWNRETFADLVEAVAEKRDRAAFATLFDHYTPRLKSYLMRRGASSDLAEELAQDALLTLWTKADQFRPDRSSVGTWLFRIARNRFIDLMRRGSVGLVTIDMARGITDGAEHPDEGIDEGRRKLQVQAVLEELPDEQREVLKLAFYDGMSQAEIAEHTGLPLGTVKSRTRLAFARLRRMAAGSGVFEVD